jgi:hypothetical protein
MTATPENENTNASNKRLISRLKAQRVYNNASSLMILSEQLMNQVTDDSDVKVNEELDKINDEITKLHDSLIKTVQA